MFIGNINVAFRKIRMKEKIQKQILKKFLRNLKQKK